MLRTIGTLCLFMTTALACMPKATFNVTIVNQTAAPVTVGIVKEGPPFEEALAGPGELAARTPFERQQWGHVIPPGGMMDSGPVTGAFPQGALAYLRVYRGQHGNSMLSAISSPSPDRADVLLYPGRSEFAIHMDDSGALKAVRVRAPAATAPAAR